MSNVNHSDAKTLTILKNLGDYNPSTSSSSTGGELVPLREAMEVDEPTEFEWKFGEDFESDDFLEKLAKKESENEKKETEYLETLRLRRDKHLFTERLENALNGNMKTEYRFLDAKKFKKEKKRRKLNSGNSKPIAIPQITKDGRLAIKILHPTQRTSDSLVFSQGKSVPLARSEFLEKFINPPLSNFERRVKMEKKEKKKLKKLKKVIKKEREVSGRKRPFSELKKEEIAPVIPQIVAIAGMPPPGPIAGVIIPSNAQKQATTLSQLPPPPPPSKKVTKGGIKKEKMEVDDESEDEKDIKKSLPPPPPPPSSSLATINKQPTISVVIAPKKKKSEPPSIVPPPPRPPPPPPPAPLAVAAVSTSQGTGPQAVARFQPVAVSSTDLPPPPPPPMLNNRMSSAPLALPTLGGNNNNKNNKSQKGKESRLFVPLDKIPPPPGMPNRSQSLVGLPSLSNGKDKGNAE